MTGQFYFWRRPHLYYRSCRCPIQFLPQTTPGVIGHDNFVSLSTQIALGRSSFIIDHTQSDRSRQFYIIFSISQTYMIGQVIDLSDFHHKLHLVRQVLIVQYSFRHKSHLYDWSSHCPVWFSLEIIPGLLVMATQYRFQYTPHLWINHIIVLSYFRLKSNQV